MKKLLALLLGLFGCASWLKGFTDTYTPAGVPNLVEFAPGMWRMGQPPDAKAWVELALRVAPHGEKVVVVKLDDEQEGQDNFAEDVLRWEVLRVPLPPEDDKPWTVLEKPWPPDVHLARNNVLKAHADGHVVLWHCVHGRDRTGLVSALVGMKLFSWTKDYAWNYMLKTGFRWELPDLDAYWVENVP